MAIGAPSQRTQSASRVLSKPLWYSSGMSEINARLWSALADLMSEYDAQRSNADNHRKSAACEQDIERLRKWMAVEMEAQKSLHTLAEVIQMLMASEGLAALAQELNPPPRSCPRSRTGWQAICPPPPNQTKDRPTSDHPSARVDTNAGV